MAESGLTLNATAASLLGFLHGGPMTGWDLHAAAEQSIGGFWTVTRSQVYRELTALAQRGFVVEQAVGARDRKPYAIEDAGRRAFAEWIDRDPNDATIRHPLLLTIAFGAHLEPRRLAEILARHRAEHARTLEEYRIQCTELAENTYAAATLDFGIRYEQATLEWFDALPPELTNKKLE